MEDRILRITKSLPLLSEPQLNSIEDLVEQFKVPFKHISRNPNLTFLDDRILHDFGDMLRLHHCFSKGPFSKDKFEFGLEATFNLAGHKAELAPSGNPAFDITIKGETFSLKTEAAKAIKLDKIHISKFMELGKGIWEDKIEHLEELRYRFLLRISQCDRILTLRNFMKDPWGYELVEIPIALFKKAENGSLTIATQSRQNPKPGYCNVYKDEDEKKELEFQLYFDGGTERKLQIKNLQKKLCSVHAIWVFDTKQIQSEADEGPK